MLKIDRFEKIGTWCGRLKPCAEREGAIVLRAAPSKRIGGLSMGAFALKHAALFLSRLSDARVRSNIRGIQDRNTRLRRFG
jgi:hypothetical protein